MDVVVPFDGARPKTRLADRFDREQRRAFATAMLRDVLDAVRAAGGAPTVLATAPVDVDAPVTVDERPLTDAVDAALAGADPPTAVVMADLALATPRALQRLFARDGDVVLVPGRGGGTNAIVSRESGFRVDYHDTSYLDHLRAARDLGASVAVVDSYRLSTDVDEPADLPEVLLHADGRAREWLREAGVSLDARGHRRSTAGE
jgi:2-phospho-L-lactate guanylyltransferase